jgi:hypothetical protein
MLTEQLGQLGGLGRRDADDVVADDSVDLFGPVAAGLGQAADDLWRRPQGVVGPAGVDAFGREGEMEVTPGGEAGLLEQRNEPFTRRAGIRRRLEHDELTPADHVREAAGGVEQGREIRLPVAGQRRRHADQDRVGPLEAGVPGRRLDQLAETGELVRVDILDVGVPGLDRVDLPRVDVDGDDFGAGPRERDREWQPDVAESDNAHPHRSPTSVVRDIVDSWRQRHNLSCETAFMG